LFCDWSVARRLELAEALDAAQIAEVFAARHPDGGGAVLEVGGGQAAFGGAGSPLSHAVGVGMQGPVTETDLNRLEQFYRERDSVPIVDLCPLADPSLSELLGARGYRISEFNNVLIRPVTASDAFEPSESLRRAAPEEADVWGRTVMTGFLEKDDATPAEIELACVLFGLSSGIPWIAFSGGVAAAAAGMAIQSGLALYFGDATMPAYRRRGLQSALIRARLGYAAAQGCDLATASTLPGTLSQRNYERLGFQVVYTKMIMSAP
jgi:GNAT superfamily N-acetyltransferase